jgi:LysM repeat protein
MRARDLARLAASLTPVVASVAAGWIFASPALADYGHVVAPGETLTSVAAQDGLTVAALAGANGMSTTARLVTGTTLEIPPATAATPAASTTAATTTAATAATATATAATTTAATATAGTAPSTAGGYVVQPGDTLTAIAARDGTTVAQLAAANGLNPNGTLLAGITLALPGARAVVTATSGSSSASSESSSAASGSSPAPAAGPPYPTDETVSASEIGQVAEANGVPAALAEAVGWQESGFDNAEVSSAGAVGVMQITPSTWSWINQTLTNGTTLAPASAASNVTGGVLFLHQLLAATGSESEAAAGYYQGLASVQRSGLYASTQQYVNDVLALAARFGG